MKKQDKERVVADLTERLKNTETLLVADYRGLTMPQIDDLRTKLLEHGARFAVVKNTLTRRAAEAAGADALLPLLEGPSAIAFIEAEGDPAAVAKALAAAARETRVLEIRGGVLQARTMTAADVEELSKLPSIDVLRGQVVGAILGPLNAIADGPSSSASSESTPAASAARRVSVFLTTLSRAPCSSSVPRRPSICGIVRPR